MSALDIKSDSKPGDISRAASAPVESPTQPGASGVALRTALVLFLFVVCFTALLSLVYQLAAPRIQAAADAHKMRLLGRVLPQALYNNDLLSDTIILPPTPELGQNAPSPVYRSRLDGKPTALVLEVVAPDGYAGKIYLLVAVAADGRLIGVRTVAHKETPGLGDYIDPDKDKNKEHPWAAQFVGQSLQEPDASGWKVKQDGGIFDARAGATISPRAVVAAVHKALRFAAAQQARLYAVEPDASPEDDKENKGP